MTQNVTSYLSLRGILAQYKQATVQISRLEESVSRLQKNCLDLGHFTGYLGRVDYVDTESTTRQELQLMAIELQLEPGTKILAAALNGEVWTILPSGDLARLPLESAPEVGNILVVGAESEGRIWQITAISEETISWNSLD